MCIRDSFMNIDSSSWIELKACLHRPSFLNWLFPCFIRTSLNRRAIRSSWFWDRSLIFLSNQFTLTKKIIHNLLQSLITSFLVHLFRHSLYCWNELFSSWRSYSRTLHLNWWIIIRSQSWFLLRRSFRWVPSLSGPTFRVSRRWTNILHIRLW